ncbi:serine/arginine repetitive matrix protein 1-like [Eucalyptus grandis]|uniref:serine/arginine repetitive matrix protein 1-like n=1 Tax=Eucalyptus grandis TaxID=71139 RepID=UPI00192ED6A6|nr:serine/arginine repetitive matrix protein 1-like [Eucalyptus grandis]
MREKKRAEGEDVRSDRPTEREREKKTKKENSYCSSSPSSALRCCSSPPRRSARSFVEPPQPPPFPCDAHTADSPVAGALRRPRARRPASKSRTERRHPCEDASALTPSPYPVSAVAVSALRSCSLSPRHLCRPPPIRSPEVVGSPTPLPATLLLLCSARLCSVSPESDPSQICSSPSARRRRRSCSGRDPPSPATVAPVCDAAAALLLPALSVSRNSALQLRLCSDQRQTLLLPSTAGPALPRSHHRSSSPEPVAEPPCCQVSSAAPGCNP